ncbi:MAG: metallopeptidase TldD-related protein [Planctomycetes bacterium]|jgi:predicted Zn-dependent protease|nr:metallopeptidase TldD-related protein [Planctomycetota bacterium]
MSFFEEVEREVRDFRQGGVATSGFRLSLAESVVSELGVERNRIGSAYAPLSVKELAGGSFTIGWSDGRMSSGSLSRGPKDALRDVLLSAFEGRYDDPEDAIFPAPAAVPEVVLFSPEAAAAARGQAPDILPGILSALAGVRERCAARIMDASAQAAVVRRRVVTSGGFRAESESTAVSFGFALDSLVGDGFSRRGLFAPGDVEKLASLTAADFEALRHTAAGAPRGRTPVVLHPRVAEQFLRTFLLANLSGGAVANGRSRFVAADFRDRRRCFREDFSLRTSPLSPLSPGSFRFTEEGVPAREVLLVEKGCVLTPLLGLKHGRKLGMEPVPSPSAIEGFVFGLASRAGREESLSGSRTLLVHSVLGMHTQDHVRGEYSLLCPQGVLYEEGRPLGRVTGTLNGSFFEDLRSEALCAVEFPGFACPGLALTAELS